MTFAKRSRMQFCFPFLGLFPRFFLLRCALSELLNPAEERCRGELRVHLSFHKNKIWKKENSKPESSEELRSPGENQIHDPPSSSSDALATEPLEALCPPGSKFNFNYIEITQKT